MVTTGTALIVIMDDDWKFVPTIVIGVESCVSVFGEISVIAGGGTTGAKTVTVVEYVTVANTYPIDTRDCAGTI